MRRQRPDDFTGTRGVWCLDLHFGSEVFRLSTEPMEVLTDTGRSLSYEGGLTAPTIRESLGRLKFEAPSLSAAIRCVLPVAVKDIRRRGWDWLQARAELYLNIVNEDDARLTVPTALLTHEQQWLQVRGRVRSPVYADPALPAGAVEFTLNAEPWENTDPVVPATARLDQKYSREVRGKRIPLVWGTPGVYAAADGTKATAPGSPTYRGGLFAVNLAESDAPTVELKKAESATLYTADITFDVTSALRIVAADPSPYTTPPPDPPETYVIWSGGQANQQLATGIGNTAPRLLVYLLSLSGLDIDAPAWEALDGQIPRLEVSGYISDDVSAWDYVQSHVLPLMPVAYRYTRQGLAPVVYDRTLRESDAVAHVRAVDTPDYAGSGDWTPLGGLSLETEPEDVPAELIVRMAKDVETGEPVRTLRWVGYSGNADTILKGPRPRGDDDASIYLDHAASRGATARIELDLEAVWDVATAQAVASWRARLACMPTEVAEYAAPWHWGWVQVGDVLLLDDASKGFDSAYALVNSREWDGTAWVFELLFTEDPVRDPRATT